MGLKQRHLWYAAKKGLWPIFLIAPIFGVLVIVRKGSAIDLIWGMAPIVIVSLGMFAYYLWRSQKDR